MCPLSIFKSLLLTHADHDEQECVGGFFEVEECDKVVYHEGSDV